MNSQQVDDIVRLFRSKAPEEYFINAAKLTHNNVKYGGLHLFDGDQPNSQKVVSLSIKDIVVDIMSVELIVGNNCFEMFDRPEIMMDLINRLVPFQGYKKIQNEKINHKTQIN